MSTDRQPTLWLDVSCLTGRHATPTGISRTVGQILPHLLADPRLRVRLCRLDPRYPMYRPVDPADVRPAGGRPSPPSRAARLGRRVTAIWQRAYGRLPRNLRQAVWHQGQSLACGYGLLKAVYYKGLHRTCVRVAEWWRGRLDSPFAAGDVLFVAGGGWAETAAPALWQQLRGDGLRVVTLVYDITPVRCRHLFDLSPAYAASLPQMLVNTDLVLTISDYSRRDLQAYARENGLPAPPVEVIRLGDEPGGDASESPPPELADGRPFVLFVSSISLHKNHPLLLQVWRRLVERHPGRVPPLVLAGGPGWRAEQVLAVLGTDPVLAAAVVHLPRTDDRQLRWLYRHCLFTVYPSQYEGWGLPVAESLLHGKHCVCSDATSLPEVGGALVDYHDPLDGVGLLRLVERALYEPGYLAARQARVCNEYRLTSWQACAAQAADRIDRHCRVARPAAREAA